MERMEVETMLSDNDQPTSAAYGTRRLNKRKNNCHRAGVGFLVAALLASVAVVALVKWMPNIEKTVATTEQKTDVQEILFKATFSTNYSSIKSNQLLDINNIDEINRQFNRKSNGTKFQALSAFMHRRLPSKATRWTKCQNPLLGNWLQVYLLIPVSHDCFIQKKNACKIQLQKDLEDLFGRMSSDSIKVQLNNDRTEDIRIKICTVAEVIDDEEESASTAPVTMAMGPKLARSNLFNGNNRAIVSKQSRCSLCINKIGLVQLSGELGTRIQDDIRFSFGLLGEENGRLSATVYEERVYRLNVQLDCGGQLDASALDNPCSRSLTVMVWIDFNDNGLDDVESRILVRSWPNPNAPTGAYYLDLHIPTIDNRYTKAGSHAMRLTVMPSEEYLRECGSFNYQETRDYTIDVVPKPRPIVVTTPRYIERNPICSFTFARIILVLMAGEKGTEIRDDLPKNSPMKNHPNQHHMAVTVFEHTIYLIRIQLDCPTQLRTELTATGCNLAQDVIVSIDLNDDGRFDESEIGTPYRWPVTSYLPQGIYDIQLNLPMLDGRYVRTGTHQMRIVVKPSEYYLSNCGFSDYLESREYTINIIPRMKYSAMTNLATPYTVLRNVDCSSDVGKILLVVMAGEYKTQIRDDPSTRAVMNRDHQHQEHFTIALHEDTVYLLRIQLECTRRYGGQSSKVNCTLPHDVNGWIDLNDDGVFDDSETATPYRWPVTSYVPEGIYDVQIYVPALDGYKVKSGPHRIRLAVTLSEDYRSKCGNEYYREIREYNVTIVRYNPRQIDSEIPYLTLADNVCSQTDSKIVLVIMTGELGTHIRDDTPMNTLIRDNQNRHHLAATLYENTIYRIRIQLDCDRPSSRDPVYDENCNLAQDVNVLIDFNDDGIFDDTESRVLNRWPLHTSVGLGIYDLNIEIPFISEQNMRGGLHKIRVVMMPSEEQQTKCGETNYREIREYTINVIPRTPRREHRPGYCSVNNLACSNSNSAIYLVKLSGEERTDIEDPMRQCSSTNNYYDRTNMYATLFSDSTYTIHIELYCAQTRNYEGSYYRDVSLFETVCNKPHYLDVWVDFNNDGVFDDNKEKISSGNWYGDDNRRAQYDLRVTIPRIDGRNYLDGQHRMRILLTQDEQNRQSCYNTGYGEARDYTVQIVPKHSF